MKGGGESVLLVEPVSLAASLSLSFSLSFSVCVFVRVCVCVCVCPTHRLPARVLFMAENIAAHPLGISVGAKHVQYAEEHQAKAILPGLALLRIETKSLTLSLTLHVNIKLGFAPYSPAPSLLHTLAHTLAYEYTHSRSPSIASLDI